MLISKKGLRAAREELARLHSRSSELAAEAGLQAEVGGNVWHDNFGWDETQKDKGIVAGQISVLEVDIGKAELIDNLPRDGRVMPGSDVALRWDGEEERFVILGSREADPDNGVISDQSPLGQILIGRSVGDRFTFNKATIEIVAEQPWDGLEA